MLLAIPIFIQNAVAIVTFVVDVTFTETSETCSLSGTYTKYIYPDGTYDWDPYEPSTATFSVKGTAEGTGFGYVYLESGKVSINGTQVPVSIDDGKKGGKLGFATKIFKLTFIPVYKKGKDSWTVEDTVNGLPLNPGTYKWDLKGKYEVEKMYWKGSDWTTTSATHDSNTSSGSWTIVHKNVPNPFSVSFNKVNFKHDEELIATIQGENLNSASMWIDSKIAALDFAFDSGQIVLSSGFSDLDLFDETTTSDDSRYWYGFVTIYISYYLPSGSLRWKTYDQYIGVEKTYRD